VSDEKKKVSSTGGMEDAVRTSKVPLEQNPKLNTTLPKLTTKLPKLTTKQTSTSMVPHA
jgi:hypothetical protein